MVTSLGPFSVSGEIPRNSDTESEEAGKNSGRSDSKQLHREIHFYRLDVLPGAVSSQGSSGDRAVSETAFQAEFSRRGDRVNGHVIHHFRRREIGFSLLDLSVA